jgi:hypothetical protein
MYRYYRYGTAAAVPTGTGTRVPVVHLTLRCTIDTRVIYMFGRKLMRKLKNHIITHRFQRPRSLLLNLHFTFYLLQNGPKRILARLIQIGSDCMYVPLLVSM